ncbi:MAG: Phosphatidylserine decarboxylase proenzyme 2 [Chlamydiae bacterium]|nr:Phosphatidylserine decarboxylase proenzyme 2 [Chlamydiota bacterium]
MDPIFYIERSSGETKEEKVYGFFFVNLLYGSYPLSGIFGTLLQAIAKLPFISTLYGKIQRLAITKRKIQPFIDQYKINMEEAATQANHFCSFNDFFIRKLKKSARPIPKDATTAIIPADGRYLFIPNLSNQDGFYVKGKKFSLKSFLQDDHLAERYEKGLMIIARLCPTDYHRFHFPCACFPEKPKLINGFLNSVNLSSLKHNIHVFSENKRMLTLLNTENFGLVVYAEVGAVCVGAIEQTFNFGKKQSKGDEKGYFAFGGSSLVLLFEPNRLHLEQDLLKSPKHTEIRCEFGQILGSAK